MLICVFEPQRQYVDLWSLPTNELQGAGTDPSEILPTLRNRVTSAKKMIVLV